MLDDARGLVLLIGPAGSGKSTYAGAFPRSWVLSLDEFRLRVADDAGDQEATADAVTVLHAALDARLRRGLVAIVDATNVEAWVRCDLVARAARHQVPAQAVVMATPLEVCLARNAERSGSRRVPDTIVCRQHALTPDTDRLYAEGFAHVRLVTALDGPRR